MAATTTVPLFHIARSKNENVVHYDLRLDDQGRPREKDPIDVYWRRDAEDGRRAELSWFERRMAYGYEVRERTEKELVVALTACDRRLIRVAEVQGSYRPLMRIAGQVAFLECLYVKTNEGGVIPEVVYVDLFGRSTKTGEVVRERLQP